MGFPMAENVLTKFQPEKLFFYNRSADKAKNFRDAHDEVVAVSSPVEIADLSDVAIVMLTDDKANDNVFSNLFKTVTKDLTIINISTITPQKSI